MKVSQQFSLSTICYDFIQDNIALFDEAVLQALPQGILEELAYHLSPFNLLSLDELWKSRGISNNALWLKHLHEIGCMLLDSSFRQLSLHQADTMKIHSKMCRNEVPPTPQDKFTKWILGKTLHAYLMQEDPDFLFSTAYMDKLKILHSPLLCSTKSRHQYMDGIVFGFRMRDHSLQIELCAKLTPELAIFDCNISRLLAKEALMKALCNNLKTLTIVMVRESSCYMEYLKKMLTILTQEGCLENLVVNAMPTGSPGGRSTFSFYDFFTTPCTRDASLTQATEGSSEYHMQNPTGPCNHDNNMESRVQNHGLDTIDYDNDLEYNNVESGSERYTYDNDLYDLAVTKHNGLVRGGMMNLPFINLSCLEIELMPLVASQLEDLSRILPQWQSLKKLHILLDKNIIHHEPSLQQFVTSVGSSALVSLSVELLPDNQADVTLRSDINWDIMQRIMKGCVQLQSLCYKGVFGSVSFIDVASCHDICNNLVNLGVCSVDGVDDAGGSLQDGLVLCKLLQQTGPGLKQIKVESQGNSASTNNSLQTIAVKKDVESLRFKSRSLGLCVLSVIHVITDLHNLRVLDLPECNIDDAFFTSDLIEALASHNSLEELLLRNNKLGDGTLQALLQVLKKAHTGESRQTRLQTLDISFSKSHFTDYCLLEFAKGMETLTKQEKQFILYRLAYIQCHWRTVSNSWQCSQHDIRNILSTSVQYPYGSLLPTGNSSLFGDFLSQM